MTAPIISRLALASLLAAAAAAAAATAEVEYVNPEKFTDAGRGYVPKERDDNLTMLRRHIVEQAGRRLPADQKLILTVTDVDLAGDYDPRQRASSELRIVKDIYPPRLDFRFKLTAADGAVVKEGTRSLRDMGFLMGINRYLNDNLRYEKQLLDDWFDEEFGRPPKR